ncbi:hypothetical protein [Stieleria tagensis]|uniref:hypothetical protein n=1 Tax=Stieleria tagensis TaxID=2956795 RepID=UPI00209ABC1F|nr:hypothetical protein [Stieleria tagensis]
MTLYTAVMLWVMPPSGDALLSDDWDYSISVFDWGQDGRLTISDFPSMTLIGHLTWGKLFAILFGNHHVVLRISTMVMAWVGALSLYRIARIADATPTIATGIATLYLLNPMILWCSYTFLTDIIGCSVMLLFLATVVPRLPLLIRQDVEGVDLQSPRGGAVIGQLIAMGVFTAGCYLVRQTAVIPALACLVLFVPLMLKGRLSWRRGSVVLFAFAVPVICFWIWITQWHGVPLGFEKQMLGLGQLTHPKIVLMKVIRIALTIAFYLSPLALAWWVGRVQRSEQASWRACAPVLLSAVGLAAALLLLPPLATARLYWGISAVDELVGDFPQVMGLRQSLLPVTIDWGPLQSNLFDLVVIPLASLSTICLLNWALVSRDELRQPVSLCFSGGTPTICAVGFVAAMGQLLLLLLIWNLFGRYLAPLMSLCLVVLATQVAVRVTGANQHQWGIHVPTFAVGLLLMATYSLVTTHDTRARFEAVWDVAQRLRGSGVDVSEIDIGMPFRGTYQYRPELASLLRKENKTLGQLSIRQRRELLRGRSTGRYQLALAGEQPSDAVVIETLTPATWLPAEPWVLLRFAGQ